MSEKGYVKNVTDKKHYGFIRSGSTEFFFHEQDFNGHWADLVEDVGNKNSRIEVEFEIGDSPKGPRARNVRRLDFPNRARG